MKRFDIKRTKIIEVNEMLTLKSPAGDSLKKYIAE